jgi:hypothetical protein
MVRDAKLARLDKYGGDIEPGLNAIVRKALKKSVEERWPSAAAFRDAIGEWLFEHRHRMTPKLVADVVADLREAVNARRQAAIAGGQANTAVIDEVAQGRAPSENLESIPRNEMDDAEVSMPVISVSYDVETSEPKPRPISVSDLASAPGQVTPAPTPTPAPTRATPPSVQVPNIPALPRTPAKGTPIAQIPVKSNQSGTMKPQRASSKSDVMRPETKSDAIVEVPIADTISAAVEAIVLPDEHRGVRSTHSFDDLTEDDALASRSRDIKLPSLEEVARKKPPTPPALSDIAEPPDDAGDFSATSPLRVLFRLMTARATGLLVVAVGGIKKEIYVRDGQPEYVSSNVASELFGNYLVTKGVLSDGELAMALAMMPHYGGKLGDTLVGLGLLKPLEVFRHLTRQVRTKIIDVCTWNKGGFAWYAGRENPREAFPLDFNAFEILGAGAMAVAEEVVDAWVAKHGRSRLRASRTRRVGPERFEVKGLVELFDTLDGKTPVDVLVERGRDREDKMRTARMLCLLEACDLARPA